MGLIVLNEFETTKRDPNCSSFSYGRHKFHICLFKKYNLTEQFSKKL